MVRRCFWSVALAVASCTTASLGADWPQWRGPERTGISQETGLLKQWPAAGPKLVWQAGDIGDGYSTPAVVGDRLYLMSNRGEEDELVLALSAADGSEVWKTRVGKTGPNEGPPYPGSRSTPTVDGDRLYALGSDGDLACLETATGKIVWSKNLRGEFGGVPGNWAYSESPLVDGNALICAPGGEKATIVALNKLSGEEIWRSALPEGDEAAYASTIIVETGGVKQYVLFLQKGLVGVDAKSGKLLWRYGKTAEGSPANIPTPIEQNGYIYSASGRGGSGLVQLKADGGTVTAEEVYHKRGLPNSIGGAVLLGKHLYGTSGSTFVCMEFATGDAAWQERVNSAGAVCYADERLYFHGEDGQVALIEPSTTGYREHGRFTPPETPERGRSKAWTYPVVANGRLYLRDLGKLWCYDVRAQQAE